MKSKFGFTTNSSSASFVICKNDLPKDSKDKIISYIENKFEKISVDLLDSLLNDNNYNILYNLIDYDENDNEMHIWILRDEMMNDDFIDDILDDYNRRGWTYSKKIECMGNKVENKEPISPKYDRHY